MSSRLMALAAALLSLLPLPVAAAGHASAAQTIVTRCRPDRGTADTTCTARWHPGGALQSSVTYDQHGRVVRGIIYSLQPRTLP